MGNLGMGVILSFLGGDQETVEALQWAKDKTIRGIEINSAADPNELRFSFDDGVLVIYDDGQSCCEHRYLSNEDDLTGFYGAQFIDADLRDADEIEDEYGTHEVQFLLINTSIGTFTVETHNEHNGYYGGFYLRVELEVPDA